MSFDHIQHLHPPRNSGVRVQWQNLRSDIFFQARIVQERIWNDLNRNVHFHRSSGLGFSRRPPSFSDDCPPVCDGGAGVSVSEGGEVGVLDGDVGGEGHVDPGSAVEDGELVDSDAVELDDWVFDSEDGEDEDDGSGG